jgi:hypothetical protein
LLDPSVLNLGYFSTFEIIDFSIYLNINYARYITKTINLKIQTRTELDVEQKNILLFYHFDEQVCLSVHPL